ncbi:Sec63 [Ascosphaera acerosa]|nr:Sec63 [Ascosphaera acerosa]
MGTTPTVAVRSPYFTRPTGDLISLADLACHGSSWQSQYGLPDLSGSPASVSSPAGRAQAGCRGSLVAATEPSNPFSSPFRRSPAIMPSKPWVSPARRPAQQRAQLFNGIELVSVHRLPDRFRSVFPFPVFNAMQSTTFPHVYENDQNIVLSSPTGSGKTVIMELAICRLVATSRSSNFRVIYQAPTKSLCSERLRDWRHKFSALGLTCAELTGDTEQSHHSFVQKAHIIITTPEKWDSMTRRWKEHAALMRQVSLFLIDEVHMLKESRGATLEAVVSRMKSMQSGTRFLALSATVPNPEDIAVWLGKDSARPTLPAHLATFGDEFRPVRLQKHVYGYHYNGNDFAFDKLCDSK